MTVALFGPSKREVVAREQDAKQERQRLEAAEKQHRKAMQAAGDEADMYRRMGLTDQERAADRAAMEHRDRAHETQLARGRIRGGW